MNLRKWQIWCEQHHREVVVGMFILLSLLLTYPLLFHFHSAIPGPPEDNLQTYWNFWWVKKALLGEEELYYTTHLFYPVGADLGLHTLTLYNSLLAVPLSFFLSFAAVYNLLLLFTFILAGLGMYLLVLYLTKHKLASFFSGLVFAFSPYHQAHALHHLNLSSIQFIPFYVLFLLKLFDTKERKHAITASIFLVLISLSSWQYMVYLILFTILFVLYHLYTQYRARQALVGRGLLKEFCIMVFLFLVLVAPFVYPVFRASMEGGRLTNLWGGDLFVADALGFFVPDLRHTLSQIQGYFLAPIYNQFRSNPWEATVSLGYTVLLLSLYALWKLTFSRKGFWFLLALLGMLLSLGPNLNVLGRGVFPFMPFRILQMIPLVNLARVPSRYIILTMLALSVIVGYSIKALLEKKEYRNRATTILLILAAVVLVEYATVPYVLTKINIPPFYQDLEEGDFALLELPLFSWKGYNQFMMYQTVHEHPLLFGSISHFPKEKLDYLKKPFFELLIFPEKITEKDLEVDMGVLQQYKVKYIAIHPARFVEQKGEPALVKLVWFLDRKFDRVYEDGRMIVYGVEYAEG